MTLGAHALFTKFPPTINGVAIGHAMNIAPNQDVQLGEVKCDGKREPVDFFKAAEKPKLSFDTYALLKLFAATGDGGLGMVLTEGLDASGGNTIVQYQKVSATGGFAASGGNNHYRLTTAKAWVGIDSLQASQDDTKPATAKITAHLLRNGTTLPNILSSPTTLTGSVALADYYTLGPLYINGADVPGIQNIDLQTGLKFEPISDAGNLVASIGSSPESRVSVKCGLQNLAALGTYPLGLTVAAGAVDFYLRHVSTSGGRDADDSDADPHLKISFSAAKVLINTIEDAQNGGVSQPMLEILNTGTVTITTATQIPSA